MSKQLEVNFAGITFPNPITTASGTFGSGLEYSEFVDLKKLGAVTTKGVANVPWSGNSTPRIVETHGGMLNAIGLQNPGIDTLIARDLPYLHEHGAHIIVNVCGRSKEDYVEVVERLADEDVDMDERRSYKQYFDEQLCVDALYHDNPYDRESITEIMELILDTVCSKRKTIRIAGDDKPLEVVKSRFMKLDYSHISYVLSCLKENSTQVRNIKQYLLAALYNAPLTISNYYQAMYNNDHANGLV